MLHRQLRTALEEIFGETKVCDYGTVRFFPNEHIGWFKIAMKYFTVVAVGESLSELLDDFKPLVEA